MKKPDTNGPTRVAKFRKRMSEDGRVLLTAYVKPTTKSAIDEKLSKLVRTAKKKGRVAPHAGEVVDTMVRGSTKKT